VRRLLGAGLIGAMALAAACGGDDAGGDGTTTTETATGPRLDQVQLLASHNSTHIEGPAPLLDAITQALPELTPTIEYSHGTLTEQLDLGVRGFELDLFEDPDGGRYASPKAVPLLELPPVDDVMADPGFKVFHIQEVDYLTRCPTFVGCLTELRTWSEANPDHLPIVVHLEAKDGTIPDPLDLGFVQPIPVSEGTFSGIEDEIRSVLDDDQVLTPAEVQGDAATLREAVESVGWPTVDELRGQLLFVLDDHGAKRDLYRDLHPDTVDRLIFVDAQPPEDDAAFTVLNDPIADGDRIAELVALGYLVRTRADADTVEARVNDTARRDAAFASGAQIISTDYEQADPRWPDYVVDLPGDQTMRCNPVAAPTDCADPDD
jgi:hypothetical protein